MRERGWLGRIGPWVALGTSPAALMAGGGVAQGIEGPALLAALGVGVLALTTLAAAQGLLGQRTHKPLLALTAGPLGRVASRRSASLVMLAMMLGWFALNTSVAGAGLGHLLGVPDRLGMALFGAAMLAIVWRGVDSLSWAALAAGIATVVLTAWGLAQALSGRPVSLIGDGHASQPVGFLQGVALIVGYGAAFSLRTPDFTRDLRRPRDVGWCALVGLALPAAAFTVAGGALYLSTGTWHLDQVLQRLGSPTLAYLFLAVGFSGAVLTNIYSGALSLEDLQPAIGHRRALVVMAIGGTGLAALRFSQWMIPYLTTVALAAPALIAICWLYSIRGQRGVGDWRAPGLLAWGGGFGAGLALELTGSSVALPAALVVAALVYVALDRRPRPARLRSDGPAIQERRSM